MRKPAMSGCAAAVFEDPGDQPTEAAPALWLEMGGRGSGHKTTAGGVCAAQLKYCLIYVHLSISFFSVVGRTLFRQSANENENVHPERLGFSFVSLPFFFFFFFSRSFFFFFSSFFIPFSFKKKTGLG
jgi:hypothetical protein